MSQSRTRSISDVPGWNEECDVAVVGQGVAGGVAAIEAARGGADTLVLERMTRGGGATALSTGITYFGGGTEIQKACRIEDSVDDMKDFYNRHAVRGEDPLFHKAAKHLTPLSKPPFGALNCSTDASFFGVFTLGGLSVRAGGEVLDADDEPIRGLFAAGRCTAGLCREGRNYASGLSISEGSYFGRLAGRSAAAMEPWS